MGKLKIEFGVCLAMPPMLAHEWVLKIGLVTVIHLKSKNAHYEHSDKFITMDIQFGFYWFTLGYFLVEVGPVTCRRAGMVVLDNVWNLWYRGGKHVHVLDSDPLGINLCSVWIWNLKARGTMMQVDSIYCRWRSGKHTVPLGLAGLRALVNFA